MWASGKKHEIGVARFLRAPFAPCSASEKPCHAKLGVEFIVEFQNTWVQGVLGQPFVTTCRPMPTRAVERVVDVAQHLPLEHRSIPLLSDEIPLEMRQYPLLPLEVFDVL